MNWPASRWTRPDSRGGRWAMQNGAWRGRSADSLWTPASLGTLLHAWWDAENGITESGGLVSAWRDRVQGVTVTQGTGTAKPIWSATSFNNRPGLTFDGTDDVLSVASAPFPDGAEPCDIWVLCDNQAPSGDASRYAFSYGNASGSAQRSIEKVGGFHRAGCRVSGGGSDVLPVNSSVSFTGRHVVRGRVGAAETQVDVDRVAGTPSAVVPTTNQSRTRIGALASTGPQAYWLGQIAHILITEPLDADQADRLYTYLMTIGGIS
jgi:hypothetical protein